MADLTMCFRKCFDEKIRDGYSRKTGGRWRETIHARRVVRDLDNARASMHRKIDEGAYYWVGVHTQDRSTCLALTRGLTVSLHGYMDGWMGE